MTVRTVSIDQYYEIFGVAQHANVFSSREFVEATPGKVEAVRFFVGYDDKWRPRLGLVAGYANGAWHVPYSAPFGCIHYLKPQQLECIYDFISELIHVLGAPLSITLPPYFYDPAMLPKICGVLGNYASKQLADFNFHFPTAHFQAYETNLEHSARKNLRRALESGFEFLPTDDVQSVYEVIRVNREYRGNPLAMTLEQVVRTIAVVPADMFMLRKDAANVAAALVYHVADGIVQVIYWGDVPGYSELRPMNLLAYQVFAHYSRSGIKIVDVGPSSKDGIPSAGLCRFKESIGCHVTLRPTFVF